MPTSIKDHETDRLVRALAAATGESLTEAIRRAVRERLERETARGRRGVATEVRQIQERLAQLPVRDPGSADELIGNDDHGLPG